MSKGPITSEGSFKNELISLENECKGSVHFKLPHGFSVYILGILRLSVQFDGYRNIYYVFQLLPHIYTANHALHMYAIPVFSVISEAPSMYCRYVGNE